MAAVSDLSDDLLYFARVNDLEEVQRLFKAGGSVNYKEPHGKSTPLHYAAANGHSTVIKFLIDNGAEYTTNDGGNTPLHWACQNKKTDVVKMLLDSYPKADVLAKNAHGKSILTYAFKAEDTEMVRLVLIHPSAAVLEQSRQDARARKGADSSGTFRVSAGQVKEEATSSSESAVSKAPPSLPVATDASTADNATATDASTATCPPPVTDSPLAIASLTHELIFKRKIKGRKAKGKGKGGGGDPVVRIRELPIVDKIIFNLKAADAAEDSTGLALWPAAIVLARWIADISSGKRSAMLRGQSVCELGAGCGLPGVAAAIYGGAREVVLTDYYGETVRNLAHNAALNDSTGGIITTRAVDWAEDWATTRFDVVVGADLVYAAEAVPLLLRTIAGCLKVGGHFLYVCPDERDGLVQFIEGAEGVGLQLTVCKEAPQAYYKNPLVKGADKQANMLFPGLLSRAQPFRLYDFVAVAKA